jgi:uncharacterized protein YcbK (DUF882 family)
MLSRRQFLAFGVAATASAALPLHPAEAALRTKVDRAISLHNIHTGETLNTVYWSNGHYQPTPLKQLNRILRDHYSGAVHNMDPKVIDLLCALQHRLGTRRPFLIVSGYRSPETNAMLAAETDGVAQHSLHMVGKAIDIRLEGMPVKTLGKAAKSLRAGGVGQYPHSDFVHVDIGPVRYW